VAILAGNFQVGRQALQRGVGEKDAKLLAEQSLADVVVAIPVRAKRGLRVIDVQDP
jgi:hypothetical protein